MAMGKICMCVTALCEHIPGPTILVNKTYSIGDIVAGSVEPSRIAMRKGEWLRCTRGHGIANAVRDI